MLRPLTTTMLCLLVASCALAIPSAKSYRPAFYVEAYWREHHVAIIRVTGVVESSTDAGGRILAEVVKTFTDHGMPTKHDIPRSSLLLWGDESTDLSTPNEGDHLLVCRRKQGSRVWRAMNLGESVERSPLIRTLGKIAVIRAEKTIAALEKGLNSKDRTVLHYCLCELRMRQVREVSETSISRLRTLYESESFPVRIRLLVYDVSEKLGSAPVDAEARVVWLKSAIKTSTSLASYDLRALVDALACASLPREDVVHFFVSLAGDPTARPDIRVAATYGLARAFNSKNPNDELSVAAFDALLQVLRDEDPRVRQNVVCMLPSVCHRITDPLVQDERSKVAADAIEKALSAEVNKSVADKMRFCILLISAYRAARELPRQKGE